jgi:hypothetical protein
MNSHTNFPFHRLYQLLCLLYLAVSSCYFAAASCSAYLTVTSSSAYLAVSSSYVNQAVPRANHSV